MAKWLIGIRGDGEVWVCNGFTRQIALGNHFGSLVILSNVDNAPSPLVADPSVKG
jgi:hypothetical protein